jgi:uncharacterized protein (DUF362 family)
MALLIVPASKPRPHFCDRRAFLRRSAALALGAPFALSGLSALSDPSPLPGAASSQANVAIVPCHSYGPQVTPALKKSFDLIGGIDTLVRNKTVTIKINLTGSDFTWFLGRPTGETYMTHSATVMALLTLLFGSGASRVRLVESTQSLAELPETLNAAGWDVKSIDSLGKVEYENTRNLGAGRNYARLAIPSGGYMFSAFHLNHSYHDTDVMISLAKLKRHITAGVTLTMKNMFGITPNSLYGSSAGSEKATEGRMPLHSPDGFENIVLPGLKPGVTSHSPFSRVPRIVADVCAARPIDLSIIDGITSMTVGEGPWCGQAGPIRFVTPGVLIVGRNPVSTDAVATSVMGYDPRGTRGTSAFTYCDNHLLLAEQAGLGTADLDQIEIRGTPLDKARYSYD